MAPWGKGRCDKIHFACKTFSSQQILAMTCLGKQVLNFILFARCDLYKNAFKWPLSVIFGTGTTLDLSPFILITSFNSSLNELLKVFDTLLKRNPKSIQLNQPLESMVKSDYVKVKTHNWSSKRVFLLTCQLVWKPQTQFGIIALLFTF